MPHSNQSYKKDNKKNARQHSTSFVPLTLKKVEVLAKADRIDAFRSGVCQADEVLATFDVFKAPAEHGIKASASDLKAVFGAKSAEDIRACCETVLRTGTFRLDTAQRKALTEQRQREIVHCIGSSYVDPSTGRPHPIAYVEDALTSIKGLRIDLEKPGRVQAVAIVQRIIRDAILPMKKDSTDYTLTLPAHRFDAARCALCAHGGELGPQSVKADEVTVDVCLLRGFVVEALEALDVATKGEYTAMLTADVMKNPAVNSTAKAKPGKGKGKSRGRTKGKENRT